MALENMTYTQLKAAKKKLEGKLFTLIGDFENNTGLELNSIDWSRESTIGSERSTLRSITVDVFLT